MKNEKIQLYATLLILLFARCWLFTWPPVLSDVQLYYSLAMSSKWAGMQIYAQYPFAYPWLSWLLLKWPATIGPKLEIDGYRFFIQAFSLLLETATLTILTRHLYRSGIAIKKIAIFFLVYTILTTLMGDLWYERVDFFMTAALMLAFAFWSEGNLSKWIAALFAGFSIKLLPLGFWAFKINDTRNSKAKIAYFISIPILFVFSLVLIDHFIYPGMITSLSSHGKRGVQIESLWATPFLLAKALNIEPTIQTVSAYGAQEVDPHHIPLAIMILAKYLGFILMGGIWWLHFKSKKISNDLYSRNLLFLVIILSFLCLQRVLSTQFLIWACPFLAISLTLNWSWMVAIISLITYTLTYICFKYGYWPIVACDLFYTSLLAIRNAGLAILLFVFFKKFVRNLKTE